MFFFSDFSFYFFAPIFLIHFFLQKKNTKHETKSYNNKKSNKTENILTKINEIVFLFHFQVQTQRKLQQIVKFSFIFLLKNEERTAN